MEIIKKQNLTIETIIIKSLGSQFKLSIVTHNKNKPRRLWYHQSGKQIKDKNLLEILNKDFNLLKDEN